MRDMTFNSIGILMVISIFADLVTISGLFRAVFNRNYTRISFKIMLVVILFLLSLLFFHALKSGKDVDLLFDIDAAVYFAGIAYFLLAAFCLFVVCFITFSSDYELLDYAFFVLAVLVPYLLGIVLHAMLFGQHEFLLLSPIFLYLAFFQCTFMSKNYVLNKILRDKPNPQHTLPSSARPTSATRFFDGRTRVAPASGSYFVRELLLVFLAFSLGIFIFTVNNVAYLENVQRFVTAAEQVFSW